MTCRAGCFPETLWRQSRRGPLHKLSNENNAAKLQDSPLKVDEAEKFKELSQEAAPKPIPPVTLDLDFVRCSVKHHVDGVCETCPYDFQMEFLSDFSMMYLLTSTPSEGLAALLDFLDIVFHLPEFASGFVLTFDFRGLYQPKLDVMVAIREWAESPCRQSLWIQRCQFWKVAITGETSFWFTYNALFCLFSHDPPSHDTYLVTDINDRCPSAGGYCFRKQDTLGAVIPAWGAANEFAESQGLWEFSENPTFFALPLVSAVSNLSDQFISMFYETKPAARRPLPRIGTPVVCKRKDIDTTPCGKPRDSSTAEASASGYPPSSCVETSALICTQRFDPETGLGELLMEVLDAPVTQDALQQIMDFMDEFTASPNAANGFCMIYDLRDMRVPSMTPVMRIAEWGNDPVRKDTWERLNKACKIIMMPGLKFSICVGILTSFFYVCPPVCSTQLMNSLEDVDAIVFEPPMKEAANAKEDAKVKPEESAIVNGLRKEGTPNAKAVSLAPENASVQTENHNAGYREIVSSRSESRCEENIDRESWTLAATPQLMSLQHFSMDYGGT